MLGGDHSYPGVQLVTWNVTEEKLHQIYSPATYLKSQLKSHNFYPTRGTTAISCPLSCQFYGAVIPHQYK